MDKFILTRKKRNYTQGNADFPTIKIDKVTYCRLQEIAAETGLSLCAVAKQAVQFAFDRLEYVEE